MVQCLPSVILYFFAQLTVGFVCVSCIGRTFSIRQQFEQATMLAAPLSLGFIADSGGTPAALAWSGAFMTGTTVFFYWRQSNTKPPKLDETPEER